MSLPPRLPHSSQCEGSRVPAPLEGAPRLMLRTAETASSPISTLIQVLLCSLDGIWLETLRPGGSALLGFPTNSHTLSQGPRCGHPGRQQGLAATPEGTETSPQLLGHPAGGTRYVTAPTQATSETPGRHREEQGSG